MRKFFHKILLLCLPLFLLFGVAWAAFLKTGEFLPFRWYIHELDSGQLIGLAYVNYDKTYKFHMTDEVFRPQVLALGSSRIMQVRRPIVSPRYTFYNAGGALQNVYEMQLFVERLHYVPEFILLTIDQYWFNPNFERQRATFDPTVYDVPQWELSNFLISSWTFYEDCMDGKVSFSRILHSKNIGMYAVCKDNGFEADGSRCAADLTDQLESQSDYNFRNILGRIERGENRFQYGDAPDSTLLDGVDRFLATCASRGIRVAAILPPFAPLVCQRMSESGRYGYMSQLYPLLGTVFSKYDGCRLYDFTDITGMGVHNYDFVDGFHGSELIYNYLIREMVLSDSTIARYFVPAAEIDRLDSVYNARSIRYHHLP